MAFILNIIIILVILGIVIFVHELGHLIACKLTKVYVEEFAIGMGPKIFSRKYGETVYSLRALPIGGFNKIRGEDFEDEKADSDPRSLVNQKPHVKLFIILSGVLMNLLLAVLIFYILLISMSFKFGLDSKFDDFQPVVGEIGKEAFEEDVKYSGLVEEAPAMLAGFPDEGVIKKIDGEEVFFSSEVIEKISAKAGKDVTIEVCDDECYSYNVSVNDEGKIGILIYQNYFTYLEYVGWQKPFVGFLHVLNWGKIFGVAVGEVFF
jgi:regulator of sigma E protease